MAACVCASFQDINDDTAVVSDDELELGQESPLSEAVAEAIPPPAPEPAPAVEKAAVSITMPATKEQPEKCECTEESFKQVGILTVVFFLVVCVAVVVLSYK